MRPDINLQMGEFVVMPNHFHAIIIIGENEYNQRNDAACRGVAARGVAARCTDAMHCVSTAQPHETNVPKTVLVHNQKIWHPSFGFQIGVTTHARKSIPKSHGNACFTTISFVTNNHLNAYKPI